MEPKLKDNSMRCFTLIVLVLAADCSLITPFEVAYSLTTDKNYDLALINLQLHSHDVTLFLWIDDPNIV